ncbi:LPS export ABC transporter permease LptG [Thiolinea disciformis]|uniref:LPS export ABC transporter permease LptG n=1 Tax=Thiolinea disciformis TaxID=125614 RepID=UPI0003628438|nr:LPS export ABC transporter permease LptG [Thiolinea disciformis]
MSLISRYLWRNLLASIVVAWIALSLLFGLFDFLAELGDVDADTRYGTAQALLYVLYRFPRTLYTNFPYAVLIGSLMGLGTMASNSEIVAMRAAGMSLARIVSITLQLGVVLSVAAFALGEWVAPRSESYAENFKISHLQQEVAVSDAGVWLKNGNSLIHIDKIWSEAKVDGLTVYEINLDEGGISRILSAETATRQANTWQLQQVLDKYLKRSGVSIEKHAILDVEKLLPDNMLSIATVQPDQLAANELAQYIAHQKENALSSERFELEYWKHFTTPLSTLVMLILAAPLVFGFQRNAGAGQRIFIGILIGIAYLLLDRIVSNTGLVYGISPFWSAVLPLIAFTGAGLFLLRRIR